MENIIEITNGPSREELFDGLRLFSEKRTIDFVFIKNGNKITVPIFITGIKAEDGSGESWNINFKINYNKAFLAPHEFAGELASNSVDRRSKAYYSTKTRKGVILK